MSSFAGATLTTDQWARGGKPSLNSKTFTDPGKPFQEGWSQVPDVGTKGSNKPTAPRNYRVAYPFNAMEYHSPGEDWHRDLEHLYCFLVYDKEFLAKKRFQNKLDQKVTKGKDPMSGKMNVTAGPIVPLRTLPGLNYGMAQWCASQAEPVKLYEVLDHVHPLAIPHNPQDTMEPYPRGSHVNNFTLVGSIDMYDMFRRPDGGYVNEGDYLYILVQPVKPDHKMLHFFNFKGDNERSFAPAVEGLKTAHYVWQYVPWSHGVRSPQVKDFSLELISAPEDSTSSSDPKSSPPKKEEILGTYYRIGVVEEVVLTENTRKNNPIQSLESTLTISGSSESRPLYLNSVHSIKSQRIIRVKLDQCLLPHLV